MVPACNPGKPCWRASCVRRLPFAQNPQKSASATGGFAVKTQPSPAMKRISRSVFRNLRPSCLGLVVIAASVSLVQAQLPLASVELPFSEAAGASSANNGELAGTLQFVQNGGYPVFTNFAPAGPFAPS